MDAIAYWFVNTMEHEGRELAQGLRRRDPDLLDYLIERYQHRLFRYLLYLTGSREAAEDFFQETWVRVLERGHQYNGKWKFETWLFAVARHLVIDSRRQKQPLDHALAEDQETQPPSELGARGESSPFDQASQREDSARIGTALTRLPATYREVLVLRFQEDLNLEEIAEVVDAPLSTVKSRLYRGLDTLRGFLEGGQA